MKKEIIVPIIVGVVCVGIGYTLGSRMGGRGDAWPQPARGEFRMMDGGQGGASANRFMRGGAGMVSGEVLSVDATGITVKSFDGGSKIVFFGASTTVTKSADGLRSDVVAGSQVTVFGSTNADGSVTAQNVQIRPVPPLPAR